MPSLVYFVACTLDGFIATDDGSTGFFGFEGPHVADLLAEFPEMIPGHLRETLGITQPNRRFDTVLMGRATYEVGVAIGVTSPYPHLRQIVVSGARQSPPDPAVELIGSDVTVAVRALKAQTGSDKDIWLAGGAGLAGSLLHEIDELILKINPIVLGSGIPLFAGSVTSRPATLDRSHRLLERIRARALPLGLTAARRPGAKRCWTARPAGAARDVPADIRELRAERSGAAGRR